jgi:hypothetical protein
MVMHGDYTTMRWPKALKTKLNLKRGHQAQVHSDQMVLSGWPGREAGQGDWWPMMLKRKLISSYRQPGDLLK